MENIIVKNLTVKYEEKNAIDNLSLEIKEGEFVCVLGKNGSGKSTFAKTLNGLVLPTSGDVEIYGMNTKDEKKLIDIRKLIGMAFQNPDNQIVASIVEEDVAFGLENLGIETSEIRKRIDEAMKVLDIYSLKDLVTSKLSGGQKQKVSLAGILAMQSKILILDEPTSMIDKNTRVDLLDKIKELNVKKKITTILITHFIEEILYADRVIIMNKGKILFDSTPIEVLKHKEILDSIGFELPYITKLAYELKKRGLNFNGVETKVSDIVCHYLN